MTTNPNIIYNKNDPQQVQRALEHIEGRIATLIEYANTTAGLLGDTLERAFGPEPKAESAPPKVVVSGQLARLNDNLDTLGSALDRITARVNRVGEIL